MGNGSAHVGGLETDLGLTDLSALVPVDEIEVKVEEEIEVIETDKDIKLEEVQEMVEEMEMVVMIMVVMKVIILKVQDHLLPIHK